MPTQTLDTLAARLTSADLTVTRPAPTLLDVHDGPDTAPFARVTATPAPGRPVLALGAPSHTTPAVPRSDALATLAAAILNT